MARSAEENRGIIYENKINGILRRAKLLKPGFHAAGPDKNAPDAIFMKDKKEWKLEIKLDLKLDFGQGSLFYDLKTKQWKIGGDKTASAIWMHDFLESIGVSKIVNKVWKNAGAPRKFTVPLESFTKADVDNDYRKFKDEYTKVPNSSIEDYYNSKGTYYIQIGGGYGTYYMGKDPAKLGVPRFDPKVSLRIRIKRGGSIPIYNYRFATALRVNTPTRSKFNMEKDPNFLR